MVLRETFSRYTRFSWHTLNVKWQKNFITHWRKRFCAVKLASFGKCTFYFYFFFLSIFCFLFYGFYVFASFSCVYVIDNLMYWIFKIFTSEKFWILHSNRPTLILVINVKYSNFERFCFFPEQILSSGIDYVDAAILCTG